VANALLLRHINLTHHLVVTSQRTYFARAFRKQSHRVQTSLTSPPSFSKNCWWNWECNRLSRTL